MAGEVRRRKLVDEALRALAEAEDELRSLVAIERELMADAQRLSKLAAQLSEAIPDSEAQLRDAWKQLQEMSMSFNLQYLALQQKMQDESRRFTLISNIMKTKHDTVKNSISNIR
jgi:seryl-tRNA synthetase